MSSLKKHVIHPQRSYSYKLLIFLFSILPLTLLAVYCIYQMEGELQSLKDKNTELASQNTQLTNETNDLSQKLTEQALYFTTEKATDTQLQERLDELQNNVVHLKKELLFYQNITQGTTSSKLQIRDLELTTLNSDDDSIIQYRLAISQGGKISTPLTGGITLTLKYDNNDIAIVNTHELKLRHIQVVDGQIDISQDKIPTKIIVTLTKNNKVILTKEFDWKIQPH